MEIRGYSCFLFNIRSVETPLAAQQCAERTLTPRRAISNCETSAQSRASPNKMRKRVAKLDAFPHVLFAYNDAAPQIYLKNLKFNFLFLLLL